MVQIQSEADYTAVVESFSDMVYRLACQNLMNTADAEDVAQDVFIRLLKNRRKCFEDREHLKAWLIRVTVNRCRDYRRFALHRRETVLEDCDLSGEMQDNRIWEEIAGLLPEERTLVYLHYYEGYSIREIGEIIGRNTNTVSSKLTRVRKKLRMMLKEA